MIDDWILVICLIIFCLGIGLVTGMAVPRGCDCEPALIEINKCVNPCQSCRALIGNYDGLIDELLEAKINLERVNYCLEPGHIEMEVCK